MKVGRVRSGATSPWLWAEGLGTFATMLIGAALGPTVGPWVFGLWLLVATCAPWWWRRKGNEPCELTCEPGRVVLTSRWKTERIFAADVMGASLAREGDHGTLALTLKQAIGRSVMITDLSEEGIGQVRASLGIPHGGVGYIAMPVADNSRIGAWVLRASAASMFLPALMALSVRVEGANAWGNAINAIFASFLGWAAALGAFYMHRVPKASHAGISLDAHGVSLNRRGADYRSLVSATLEKDRIEIRDNAGALHVARTGHMSSGEAAVLTSQLQSAIARAHGLGASRIEQGGEVLRLERGDGESVQGWLARLDAQAVGADGYRAAGLNEIELTRVLDDPDADALLRAAAGRVLARNRPELRVRVAALTQVVHEPRDEAKVRFVLSASSSAADESIDALFNGPASPAARDKAFLRGVSGQ